MALRGTPPAFTTGSPDREISMLRLTRTTEGPLGVVLKAEGLVMAEWAELLEAECRELLAVNLRVVLDLGGVRYLDRAAVHMLRELTRGTLGLVNCPPLVEELLAEDLAK
jgi:anti-anti-sigma regulatory factor